MNSKQIYPYAQGDLLVNRNTYFYSQYHGETFIAAWRKERHNVIAFSSNSTNKHPQVNSSTRALLEKIQHNLGNGKEINEALAILKQLTQRFEVSKRLHGEYNNDWRPVNQSDFQDLECYILFAESLHLAYSHCNELPFLNALLKCIDTLSALKQNLDSKQFSRLRSLIAFEDKYIQKIADKHNI